MDNFLNQGSLHLIMGCMASGKSSEVIRRYRRYLQTYKPEQIGLLSHSSDTRYGQKVISTHDKTQIESICLTKLEDIKEEFLKQYQNWKIIFIEEGQFFNDLKEFVLNAVDVDKKKVIVSGLDGDYQRNIFGQIVELIPFADEYVKLKAICSFCRNGTEALFTKRVTDSQEQTLVGCLDIYKPVCRYHYLH